MQIIDLELQSNEKYPVAVALGNFDGFHLAHRKLIEEMVTIAKNNGLKSSLLLFENHTGTLTKNKRPAMLTNNQQKYSLARDLGVDFIFNLKFTEGIMKLTEEEFIKEVLIEKINTKVAVVGFDYRFGYKAKGDANILKALGEDYAIDTYIVNPVLTDEDIISSTMIRKLIREGLLEDARALLGRDYSVIGKVVKGAQRGSKLGFPTANLEIDPNYVLPPNGVYYTETTVNGKKYKSVTDIGFNPTFGEKNLKIESHILDFNASIYGNDIEVHFKKFLREDIWFSSKEELIVQIEKDVELVRSL